MSRGPTMRRLALAGGLLLAAFLATFAADVFTESAAPGGRAVALLMHLLPALLVLAATLAGWRWPVAGAVAFASLALAHLAMSGGRLDWRAYVVIDGALLGGCALFLLAVPRRGQPSTR